MTASVVLLLVGLALLLAVLWFARFRPTGVRARLTLQGFQQVDVTIQGRYRPDVIIVEEGVPVRIDFLRNEDALCSERVVFSDFNVDRRLPAFQKTSVDFVPTRAGSFLFTCHMGMYRGKLMVVARPGR